MEPLTAPKRSALIQYKKDPKLKILSGCKKQGEKVNSWQGAMQMNTG